MRQLTILREGPGYVVVNKPAGIATERHFQHDTVEARAQVQWKRPAATKPPYVGIVHRLDRPVSGALLLARNKSTLVKVNQAFAAEQTEKTYWACTDKPLPESAGELRSFLGRDRTRRRALVTTRPVPGSREGALNYRLLREANGLYLYEVELLTGRFHQIRAQLAFTGAPIIGDHQYGAMRPLGEHVIALHARRLAFPDPKTGDMVEAVAGVPDYWPLGK